MIEKLLKEELLNLVDTSIDKYIPLEGRQEYDYSILKQSYGPATKVFRLTLKCLTCCSTNIPFKFISRKINYIDRLPLCEICKKLIEYEFNSTSIRIETIYFCEIGLPKSSIDKYRFENLIQSRELSNQNLVLLCRKFLPHIPVDLII